MSATSDPMDEVNEVARLLAARLGQIRATVALPDGLQWYPYSTSIHNLQALDQVLTGDNRSIFRHAPGRVVADIGGADGDMAFLMEALGAQADLIDCPATSNNRLMGARTYKRELGSSVQIHELDIDTQFTLPRQYDLVMLFGILYHLKNPYYVLEHLARNVGHMFLSTKVTAYSAPLGDAARQPIPGTCAYLLGAEESDNGDATNYWVFTEAGLRMILRRSGWQIVDVHIFGDLETSDPSTIKGDCRAFCYLRSLRV